ncbi:PREDICTED: olfactory receptor 5B21-like [Chaetura pelagica]|uniref:olfactory receptor 5B21-like n=1 Tax=Chaetura pelagica TaxID=8897 RepID=UPI00052379ED|nr:PREDICTED: olfactory receptor 5B21-like [Chaetura pelagica]
MENHTKVTEFILVGFKSHPGLQLLSVLFSAMYVVTVVGNACMILIIQMDSKLHTPMYFFLENLSILDICYSSVITPNLSFCGRKEINHFFSDVPAVMRAACSDTLVNEIVMLSVCGSIIVGTASVAFLSCGYIILTIVQMPSAESRHKAFSTCSSHMLAVSLFFGTVFFMYAQPSADKSNTISILYTIVIPMLNPFICTLQKKEVKESLTKQFKREGFFSTFTKGENDHSVKFATDRCLECKTSGLAFQSLL